MENGKDNCEIAMDNNVEISAVKQSSTEPENTKKCSVDRKFESAIVNLPSKVTSDEDTKIAAVKQLKTESNETKKRSLEEELKPMLVRLPSDSPSCSSDCILINKDQFKIGRRPDNDEVILSVLISRNHCVLEHDKNSGEWFVKNLSSTDTLINDKSIRRNESEIIREGDILQLSLSDNFMYKFTLIKEDDQSVKHPRLESNDCELGIVLNKQRSFVECQENQRKDLEKQLLSKQQEQERLKEELEKLLQDQKVTITCNEELNNQIAELQKKIELGNSTELQLQEKYRDLLKKLEEERQKFEEKLAEEKQKWQEMLKETKQEKEKLEMSMVEQMEEWRVKLEKKQQEEWQKKIDNLLQEEKTVQIKLQDEKLLLQEKLKEMEEALKKREQAQEQQNAQPIDIQNCIIVEIEDPKNFQLPILETIDLTGGSECTGRNLKNVQDESVIDKVNNIMDEQLTCSICSELFVRAMTLNCMHTFCRYCIDMWIKKRRDCPNCRASIVSMTRSLVVDNFIEKMLESLTPEQMSKRNQLIEERKIMATMSTRKKQTKRR